MPKAVSIQGMSAGLKLSVGYAAPAERIVLAVILFLSAVICLAAAKLLAGGAPLLVPFVAPVGVVGVIAAVFVAAPHSRFATWLDELVPRLARARIAFAVALAIEAVSAVLFL